MGDLFHEAVDEKFIAKVFAIMDLARQHIYCILTKRPGRAFQLLTDEDFQFHVGWFQSQVVREFGLPKPEQVGPWPLRNVWLGVSVENQEAADERIPLLLQTPAAVRFISAEPLLGPVDLELYLPYHNHPLKDEWHRNGYHIRRLNIGITEGTLDWIICGGETGPGARPMHPDWARILRDQAVTAGIPFFFKSWGEWVPYRDNGPLPPECSYVSYDGQIRPGDAEDLDTDACMGRVGKKRAGRLLDGRTWDEYPMEGGPLL
jgi:protein gp37